MAVRSFIVSIFPSQVHDIIKNWDGAELLYDECKDFGNGKGYAACVFEKYFFRNKSRAGLTVLCDNARDETEVRIISSGSADGLLFSFDWGAGNDFVYDAEQQLADYWVRDTDSHDD